MVDCEFDIHGILSLFFPRMIVWYVAFWGDMQENLATIFHAAFFYFISTKFARVGFIVTGDTCYS